MGRLGADPEELRRVGAELVRAAASLEAVSARTGRSLRAAPWTGPDAAAARATWARRGPVLAASAARCRSLGRSLVAHAEEQVRAASATRGPALAGTAGGGAAGGGTVGGGTVGGGTVGGAAPWGGAPGRTTRWAGTLSLSGAVVSASFAGSVETEDLPHGRTAVTATTVAGVGASATATAGTWVEVDGRPAGAGGRAGVGAEGRAELRRRWEVDDGDVDALLAQLALEGLASSGGVAGIASPARRWLTGDALIDHPVWVERTVGIDAAAAATGGAGSGGAAASAEGGVRVGRLDGQDGPAAVLEYRGSAGAAAPAALTAWLGAPAPSAGGTVRARVVAPIGPSAGDRSALVVLEQTAGERATRVEARVELPAGGEPDAVGAAEALAAGSPATALARLTGAGDGPVPVRVRAFAGRVVGHRAAGGGGALVGVEASGGASTTTWRPVGPRRATGAGG